MILRSGFMNILVFKTSITAKEEILQVSPLLDAVPTIKHWNFDLDDCDNILRIVSNNLDPELIESLLETAGFKCQELAD
ncbi:hypothetical protein WG906_19100 [Pedobacter sp. P351]|uniref:hypothetical protein n=1 Tax=Pedobacter superstes TaxID=3133441 RepID=UPI0030B6A416